MTSIIEALTQLFLRWGIGFRYVQWCVAGVLGGYVGLAVLSVFLSSWGFQWLIWIFVAFYIFGVINLMTSPFLWGTVAVAAYGRGQVGGQEGLSIEDGIKTVLNWGTKTIGWTAKFLLFYGAVPFIWTALFQTKGWEEENLVALILLPTVIYFTLVRWPNSQSVFNIIGYVLIAVVLVGVLGTIYNTVERRTTDPAAQAVLGYLDQVGGVNKANDKLVAESIISKLKAKQALTADEEKAWDILRKEAEAQSLRPGSLKQKAEAFVENAKPTDKSWWKAHWVTVGGIALAIAIGYFLFERMRGATAGATPAAAPTSKKGWLITLAVLLAIGGWVWSSIDDWRYERTLPLTIRDMSDQRLCGIRPGSWRFSFPGEQRRENDARIGRSQAVGIFVRSQNGVVNRYSVVSNLMVNDTFSGKEEVTVGSDGCVKVAFFSPAEFKETAVVLGGDIINNEKPVAFAPDAPAQPYTTLVRFANN